MKIGRREFLIGTGAALLTNSVKTAAQTSKRIIVAGAGLSGLSAAYELAKRGYAVTVLEARSRVGGRVFTLHSPFVDGQYAEYGGELIGDGYKRFLGYIKRFKIPYEEVPVQFETSGSVSNLQSGTGTTAVLKDTLYPVGSFFEPHPYGLQGDEAKGLPPLLLSRNLRAMAKEAAENPEKLFEFDNISLADALRRRGVSDAAIRLANIALNYNSIETVSAGGVLFDAQRRQAAGTKAFRIIGGNYNAPTAFYERNLKAGVKFIFGANVKEIAHDAGFVKVSYVDKNGNTQLIEAAKLVCTIPFSVLRDVKFSPALPDIKSKAIHQLGYAKVTRVFMQGSRVEWDRRNIGTSVWTDTPLERIFELAGKRGDARGIFSVWADGEGAEFLERMSDGQRQIYAKNEFERILPFMKDQIERTATKSWTNDEFAHGAYSHFTVGQMKELKPHIKTSVGAIHFAGEHTAEFSPGMEAAFESAERVVKEIAG